jgi:hypothetical protein
MGHNDGRKRLSVLAVQLSDDLQASGDGRALDPDGTVFLFSAEPLLEYHESLL